MAAAVAAVLLRAAWLCVAAAVRSEALSLRRADGAGGASISAGRIPVTAEQHAAAVKIAALNTGGMVSMVRRIVTAELAMKALEVDGDFVETGTYNGGTAVLMGEVMLPSLAQKPGRKLWLADSFQGLPAENATTAAVAVAGTGAQATKDGHKEEEHHWQIRGLEPATAREGKKGNFSIDRSALDNNLRTFNMSEDHKRVEVLQGWFKDTLPKAPIGQIAYLRLDGDLYVSTWQAITALYDKVVPGGYIYVDDYGSFEGCRQAIDQFRTEHGIHDELSAVPEDDKATRYEAVWWRKGSAGSTQKK